MNVAHHEFSSSCRRGSQFKGKAFPPLSPCPLRETGFAFGCLLFCILPICLSTSDRLSTPTSPNELFCLTVFPPPPSPTPPTPSFLPSRYIGHKVKMLINAVEAQISSGFCAVFLSSSCQHRRPTHKYVGVFCFSPLWSSSFLRLQIPIRCNNSYWQRFKLAASRRRLSFNMPPAHHIYC